MGRGEEEERERNKIWPREEIFKMKVNQGSTVPPHRYLNFRKRTVIILKSAYAFFHSESRLYRIWMKGRRQNRN